MCLPTITRYKYAEIKQKPVSIMGRKKDCPPFILMMVHLRQIKKKGIAPM